VDRVAIVGCGGSGKSWLARSLGGVLGIKPVHLDGRSSLTMPGTRMSSSCAAATPPVITLPP